MKKPINYIKFNDFLKSKKGGISNLIFEVVISVLILSLLVVVIYVFRNNMDIIGNTANKVNDTDKIKAEAMLPLDKNTVTGSEVIAVLRFYSNDNTVEIDIKIGGLSKSYVGENYSSSDFPINYEDKFESIYEYEGAVLKTIKYSKI